MEKPDTKITNQNIRIGTPIYKLLQEGMRFAFGGIVYKVIRVRRNGKITIKPIGTVKV